VKLINISLALFNTHEHPNGDQAGLQSFMFGWQTKE